MSRASGTSRRSWRERRFDLGNSAAGGERRVAAHHPRRSGHASGRAACDEQQAERGRQRVCGGDEPLAPTVGEAQRQAERGHDEASPRAGSDGGHREPEHTGPLVGGGAFGRAGRLVAHGRPPRSRADGRGRAPARRSVDALPVITPSRGNVEATRRESLPGLEPVRLGLSLFSSRRSGVCPPSRPGLEGSRLSSSA